MDITVNPLAIVLAALSMFLIGGIWYSALFAKRWQREAGLTDEQLRSGAPRVFIGSLVLSLVAAASLAAFIGSESLAYGAAVGAVTGLTFAAAPLGIVALFERRPHCLVLINSGYLVVAFTVMGVIVGALQ